MLFTSFPALGHFLPVAPLAAAALAAGHDVKVVSGADLCRWAANAGFDTHPVGGTQAELIAAVRTLDGDVPSERLFSNVWVGAAFPDMLDVTNAWRPDIIVHEEEEYSALLVASIVGTPIVTHSWNSPARAAAERATAAQLLASSWAEHHCGWPARTTGDLYLDACPPALQEHDTISRISNVITVRPVSFTLPPLAGTPLLVDVPRPAAYLTLGTVPVFSTPERLRHLINAVSPAVATLIVTTGPNPVASLGRLPSNVLAFDLLPQTEALSPRGHRRVARWCRWHARRHRARSSAPGHPVRIAEPDRPRRRDRTSRRSDADSDPIRRDLATIRTAVRDLLTDPTFRRAATLVHHDLQRLPSPTEIIRHLESLHPSK